MDITPFSSAPGSVVVLDYDRLRVAPGRVLTIQGNANTAAVVLRLARRLRVDGSAQIVMSGIPAGPNGSPAERILFLVGGRAFVRRQAQVQGTIFAQGLLRVGRDAVVTGALLSARKEMRVGWSADLINAPWVLW